MVGYMSPSEQARIITERLGKPGPVLGVDIGGTKLAAGVVAPTGRVLSYARRPTPTGTDGEAIFRVVVDVAQEALQGSSEAPIALGIGCGGPLFFEEDTVSPMHMPGWRKFPLRPRLEAALVLPAVLDNDAKAFALGEAHFGAGKGATCMLGMVVSTGIGGGVVVEGRLVDGAHGNGGHVGHIITSVRGPRCFCGAVGCLTAYMAGRGLAARATLAIVGGATSGLSKLPQGSITGKDIAEAAGKGDALSLRLFNEAARSLGRAIASAANTLDLDRVVLGGGLLQAGDLLLKPFYKELRRRACLAYSRHLDVRLAALGPESGVIGAATLIAQHWQARSG